MRSSAAKLVQFVIQGLIRSGVGQMVLMNSDGQIVYYAPRDSEVKVPLDKFCQQLTAGLAAAKEGTMEAVYVAAWAHARLVAIHPYIDGNGRASRMLLNSILDHCGTRMRLSLPEDRRAEYNRLLAEGSRGNPIMFIAFVLQQELPHKIIDEIFGEGCWDNERDDEWNKLTLEQNALHQIDRQYTQLGQNEPNSTDQNPPPTESDHYGQIEPKSTDQNPPPTESDHYEQIEPKSTDQNPPLTESDHYGKIEPNSTDQNPPLT
uniref:Fido domain-containing protein n=1 Tax=Globodera rostochiensis TaxID=31243 RepID=A0A914HHF7_GLORO